MKRTLLPLLTAAFCLTACAPAAPASTSELPATTENTATAESAAQTQVDTFSVAGTLREVEDAALQENALYTLQFGDTPEDTTFVKVDLQAAQQTPLCKLEDWGASYVGWLVKGDTFYYMIYDEDGNALLHGRSLTDGSETVWTLAVDRQYPAYLDDQYLYFTRADYTAGMKRVDLTTGVLEDLPLPAQTTQFMDVDGSRFLIARLLTPVPMNVSPEETEQYDALMQNTEIEYCWWDPATGALEKVLREPYYGEEDAQGNRIGRLYLGKAEGKLYFYRVASLETGLENGRVERCGMDGSGVETVFALVDERGAPSVLKLDGEIHWLLHRSRDVLTVYLPDHGQAQQVPAPAGDTPPWPERSLPDGRLLLPQQEDGSYQVVSEADYLAGNFTGTTIPAL